MATAVSNFTDNHGPAGSSGGVAEHNHAETYIQKMLIARYWLSVGELAKAQDAMAFANFHRKMCVSFNYDPMARRDFVKLPRWIPASSKVWRAAA